MSLPTPEELILIDQFRDRLADLDLNKDENDNMFLVRWIRARDNKLDQAESLLRKARKYEQEHDLRNVLTWKPPELLTRMIPWDVTKRAKDKTPVVFAPVGLWDLKGVMELGMFDDLIRYGDQCCAFLTKQCKGHVTSEGAPLTQSLWVTDAANVSITQFTSVKVVQAIKMLMTNFLDHRPESLRGNICINTSRAFQGLYSIMRPLMTARTKDKFQVLTTSKEWMPVLKSLIDDDQLPEYYGGRADSNIHPALGHVYSGK